MRAALITSPSFGDDNMRTSLATFSQSIGFER
jgi:hypothetical protein